MGEIYENRHHRNVWTYRYTKIGENRRHRHDRSVVVDKEHRPTCTQLIRMHSFTHQFLCILFNRWAGIPQLIYFMY